MGGEGKRREQEEMGRREGGEEEGGEMGRRNVER